MSNREKQLSVAHITAIDMSLHYLLLNQMQSIKRDGYAVYGISGAGNDVPIIEAAGIAHIDVFISRNISPFSDLVSLWRLWRIFRRHKFAVVHTHTPKPGLLGQLAARFAGVPVVINTLHGFYFHGGMSRRKQLFYIMMEKIAARCSHVILSQSEEDIQTALREGICKPDKIKHLGNGIDLKQFDPGRFSAADRQQKRAEIGIPENAPVVGFVGRLAAKRKGFADFLAAAQQLVEQVPDVHFLIVGDADRGKPDAMLPEEAAHYGVAERCHFMGQRPNSELPLLYTLMHVLVLPSLFEGVPRAIMEAAAMGVPAVASNVKGNREAVQPDMNGLLVPLGDVPALTAAIARVLTDPALAAQFSAGGRQLAQERFDEELVFQKVKDEYAYWLRKKGLL